MNTFKKGDVVKAKYWQGTVAYISGPFVYCDNLGCAHYTECTLVLPHKFDFVAAVAAPKATPTFKVGDIVKHHIGPHLYEVNDVREDGHFYIKAYPHDGYNDPRFFSLVSSPIPSAPHIVIRKDTGKGYRPNDKPRVHNNLAEATKEAERLALANPGIEFATFSLATTSRCDVPAVTTVAA